MCFHNDKENRRKERYFHTASAIPIEAQARIYLDKPAMRVYNSCVHLIFKEEGGVSMAVPKRKTSKQRRDKRRASSYRLTTYATVKCPNCGEAKLPHHICPHCGYYDGKEVIQIGE